MPEPAAKILVADDDQSLVRTLTWILKENGYEVVTAPGGEGLLGKLEDERPNLLLLDIMMPKVDGLQLLARMKADDRFRDVPVLMISAAPSPSDFTVASSGGIEEIINTGTSRNRSSAFIRASSWSPSTFGIMMSRSSRLGRSSSSLPMSPSPPGAMTTSYPFSFRIQVKVRTND